MTTSNAPRACGRPTKSGGSCRNPLYPGDPARACGLHETAEDVAYREGYRAGATAEREYAERGRELSRESWIAEGRRLEHLEARERESFRVATDDEEQIVVVDSGYSYRWGGEPLKIGDRVMLPANWLSEIKNGPGPFPGTVTAIGSSYQGELSAIVRKIADTSSVEESA